MQIKTESKQFQSYLIIIIPLFLVEYCYNYIGACLADLVRERVLNNVNNKKSINVFFPSIKKNEAK